MPEKTFEQALKALERIVEELETGDLPLEKAITRFEEGVELSKYCTKKLDETEKRIIALMRDPSGKIVEKPSGLEPKDDDEPQ